MICCFFGHRDATEQIRKRVFECLEKRIVEEKITDFYIGNQGAFDRIVYGELKKLKMRYPNVTYTVVLAYFPKNNEEYYSENETIYPEELEGVPKKAAIVRRNRWMINQSTHVIVYRYHTLGNTFKLEEYAKKKGKFVFNLAD